jgi:hypothetical protein
MAANGFSWDANKNPLFIGFVMAEAWEQNLKSKTLIVLCEALIKLGQALLPATPKAQAAAASSSVEQPELGLVVVPKLPV